MDEDKVHTFLERVKTLPCAKRFCANGRKCRGYHNNSEKRRPPSKFKYSWVQCSEARLPGKKIGWRHPVNCRDNCEFAHTVTEHLYHDEKYKTKICVNGRNNYGDCPRGELCSHAHGENEIRGPSQSNGVRQPPNSQSRKSRGSRPRQMNRPKPVRTCRIPENVCRDIRAVLTDEPKPPAIIQRLYRKRTKSSLVPSNYGFQAAKQFFSSVPGVKTVILDGEINFVLAEHPLEDRNQRGQSLLAEREVIRVGSSTCTTSHSPLDRSAKRRPSQKYSHPNVERRAISPEPVRRGRSVSNQISPQRHRSYSDKPFPRRSPSSPRRGPSSPRRGPSSPRRGHGHSPRRGRGHSPRRGPSPPRSGSSPSHSGWSSPRSSPPSDAGWRRPSRREHSPSDTDRRRSSRREHSPSDTDRRRSSRREYSPGRDSTRREYSPPNKRSTRREYSPPDRGSTRRGRSPSDQYSTRHPDDSSSDDSLSHRSGGRRRTRDFPPSPGHTRRDKPTPGQVLPTVTPGQSPSEPGSTRTRPEPGSLKHYGHSLESPVDLVSDSSPESDTFARKDHSRRRSLSPKYQSDRRPMNGEGADHYGRRERQPVRREPQGWEGGQEYGSLSDRFSQLPQQGFFVDQRLLHFLTSHIQRLLPIVIGRRSSVADLTNPQQWNAKFQTAVAHVEPQFEARNEAAHHTAMRSLRARQGCLRTDSRRWESRLRCGSCREAEVAYFFVPCGHLSCPKCGKEADLCPQCHCQVGRVHELFL
eukprot:802481_1